MLHSPQYFHIVGTNLIKNDSNGIWSIILIIKFHCYKRLCNSSSTLLSLLYRWKHWNPETLGGSSSIRKLVRGRYKARTQIPWVSHNRWEGKLVKFVWYQTEWVEKVGQVIRNKVSWDFQLVWINKLLKVWMILHTTSIHTYK